MSKKIYNSYDKPSAAVIVLNVLIIVLLCAIIVLLGLYTFSFYTGKSLNWFNLKNTELQPNYIEQSSDTVTITQMTTTEVTTESVTTQTSASETTASTAETEPKYNSTDYDKEFFGNTLFVGDSIFTGFSGFGYLAPENVFAQVGLNPESVITKEIDGVTAVSKAEAMQPEYICIMLGTNGLAFLGTDYMANEMSAFVKSLEDVCPNSEVVILSIPPVTEEHEKENPEKIPLIEEYNSKLKQIADDNNCMFIDIFTMLQDDKGYLAEEYAEADGLHFLGKAYGVVLSRIQFELSGGEAAEEETVSTTAAVPAETTETVSQVVVVVPDINYETEAQTEEVTE